MTSSIDYNELQTRDLEERLRHEKKKTDPKYQSKKYSEDSLSRRTDKIERTKDGLIAPTDHVSKSKAYSVSQAIAESEKPDKLSRRDKQKHVNHLRWRNHYKFVGILPDFRGFEKLKMKQVIEIKHFREKRTFINIFEWLSPDNVLLKVSKVCKKFYMLTWNDELLTKLAFNCFGTKRYNEIRFRIAKRLHQV